MRDKIRRMIKTFFQRWWLLRQLRGYIYDPGMKLDTTKMYRPQSFDFEAKNTKPDDRIEDGVDVHIFKDFYLEGRVAKLLYKNKAELDDAIKDCQKLDWIERDSNKIKVGHAGRSYYVWYYPFLAFLVWTDTNKAATICVYAVVGYVLALTPLLRLPWLAGKGTKPLVSTEAKKPLDAISFYRGQAASWTV